MRWTGRGAATTTEGSKHALVKYTADWPTPVRMIAPAPGMEFMQTGQTKDRHPGVYDLLKRTYSQGYTFLFKHLHESD